MLPPGDDPESGDRSTPAARGRGRVGSDFACPWCGGPRLQTRKKMPSPNGPGLLAYIFFPIALMYWLGNTTFNECLDCGGRWQRGVAMASRRPGTPAEDRPEPEARAGMYAEQVPVAAVVRRRPRLGPESRPVVATGDVVLIASREACRTCRQAAGRYEARNAPALPIAGCTCDGGCTCTASAAED